MIYEVAYTREALDDLDRLRKTGDTALLLKFRQLIAELQEHPYTGTGKPERMKYGYVNCYSRRISQKHRLVYQVQESRILVLVLAAFGHYDDK